jgi:DNA-binding MarR family transcriptional regulator
MHATDASAHASTTAVAQELVRLLHELMRGTGGRVVEALNAQQLSLTQMKALSMLDHDADADAAELSIKELGTCLTLSLPAASRTIDSLLQRGLVTRTEDPADRRIKRLAITAEGREVLRALEAARMVGVERWAAALTTEQRDALHAALLTLRTPTPKDPTHA